MLETAGIILAGGKSKRMGQDKAFLLFDQKPLIEEVIDIMCELFTDIIVVTNNLKAYDKYRQKVTLRADIIPECGPLGGIYTGLLSSPHRYNFVVACDTPFINKKLIGYMVRRKNGYDAVIPKIDGKFYPLFGVYSKNCIPVIKDHLKEARLKISDTFPLLKTHFMAKKEIERFDQELASLTNINTKEDYELLKKREKICRI